MADTKITALIEDTAPAGADWLVSVDTSDPTMDPAGSNKKVSVNSLLRGTYLVQTATGAPPTAQVLASLATGVVKVTTGTGVLSTAVAGTDYLLPTGSGAGLTNLNAASLASGIAPPARLGSGTATVAQALRGDSTWGDFLSPTGSGASLTNLHAPNLATGLVPTARLGGGTASVGTALRGDSTWGSTPKVLFAAFPGWTIANTAVESAIVSGGLGSTTIPAGILNQAGKMLRITAVGGYSTDPTPGTLGLWCKFGSLVAATIATQTLAASLSMRRWSMELLISTTTAGSSGRVDCGGKLTLWTGATAVTIVEFAGALTSVDLTASQVVVLTWKWGTASTNNTMTTSCYVMESLN